MLDVEVVGIVRETSQFLFTGGMVFLSPGTRDAHPQMELIENAHVRLRNHEKDVPALRQDAIAALAAPGTPVLDLHAVLDRVGTAISLERVAQGLLGLAVAAAALVFVGQALARSVSLIDDDAIVLRAARVHPSGPGGGGDGTPPRDGGRGGARRPAGHLGPRRLASPSGTHARWIRRSAIRSTGRSLVLPWC